MPKMVRVDPSDCQGVAEQDDLIGSTQDAEACRKSHPAARGGIVDPTHARHPCRASAAAPNPARAQLFVGDAFAPNRAPSAV